MNRELQDVQVGCRKGRETIDQNVNIHWNIEEARKLQKIIYFSFDYAKSFDCVDLKKSVENSWRNRNINQPDSTVS